MANKKYIPALGFAWLTPFYDPVQLTTQKKTFIADWGYPANILMRSGSYFIQMLDGFETTSDNFEGLLPEFLKDAEFENINETQCFNTVFGTIRLYKILKR